MTRSVVSFATYTIPKKRDNYSKLPDLFDITLIHLLKEI